MRTTTSTNCPPQSFDCYSGYERLPGDTPGWGTVGGIGGGSSVEDCGVCGKLCDLKGSLCGSYECSPTTKLCNLNAANKPANSANYNDWAFCSKTGKEPGPHDRRWVVYKQDFSAATMKFYSVLGAPLFWTSKTFVGAILATTSARVVVSANYWQTGEEKLGQYFKFDVEEWNWVFKEPFLHDRKVRTPSRKGTSWGRPICVYETPASCAAGSDQSSCDCSLPTYLVRLHHSHGAYIVQLNYKQSRSTHNTPPQRNFLGPQSRSASKNPIPIR